MFDGASIFDQDLSSWDFCEMDFDNVFTGTNMGSEHYPVGCDSQSPSGQPSISPSVNHAFVDNQELRDEVVKYAANMEEWAESECNGIPCGERYGYAKLLT
jgi:hypothetical protein